MRMDAARRGRRSSVQHGAVRRGGSPARHCLREPILIWLASRPGPAGRALTLWVRCHPLWVSSSCHRHAGWTCKFDNAPVNEITWLFDSCAPMHSDATQT
jgi:hypothetical protein